jgi:hypothetical protein
MPVVFSHPSLFRKLYQYTTIGMVSMKMEEQQLPTEQADATETG